MLSLVSYWFWLCFRLKLYSLIWLRTLYTKIDDFTIVKLSQYNIKLTLYNCKMIIYQNNFHHVVSKQQLHLICLKAELLCVKQAKFYNQCTKDNYMLFAISSFSGRYLSVMFVRPYFENASSSAFLFSFRNISSSFFHMPS